MHFFCLDLPSAFPVVKKGEGKGSGTAYNSFTQRRFEFFQKLSFSDWWLPYFSEALHRAAKDFEMYFETYHDARLSSLTSLNDGNPRCQASSSFTLRMGIPLNSCSSKCICGRPLSRGSVSALSCASATSRYLNGQPEFFRTRLRYFVTSLPSTLHCRSNFFAKGSKSKFPSMVLQRISISQCSWSDTVSVPNHVRSDAAHSCSARHRHRRAFFARQTRQPRHAVNRVISATAETLPLRRATEPVDLDHMVTGTGLSQSLETSQRPRRPVAENGV